MRRWKLFMAVGFMAVCMGGCGMQYGVQTSESAANTEQGAQTSESAANTEQGAQTSEPVANTEQGAQTSEPAANTEQGTQISESAANTEQGAQASESAANAAQDEKVDLSGMDPYAANEIMGTLDDINEQVLKDAQTGTEAVIRNTVHLMGVAVGNSLVEDQVARVVKAWKQQKSESELRVFMAKYELVYEEYGILNSDQAEEELAKAQYKLADYDYCGNGQLDMVEWIKNSLEGND